MFVKRETIVDWDSMLGHVVLHCMAETTEMLAKARDNGGAEVKLTIDGQEADLESFVNHWQSQVNDIINKRAKKIALEKYDETFGELGSAIFDLRSRFESLIPWDS